MEGTRASGRIGLPKTLPPIIMQDHNKQQMDDQKQGHYTSKRCGESTSERPGNKSHATKEVRHEGLIITRIDPPGQVQVWRVAQSDHKRARAVTAQGKRTTHHDHTSLNMKLTEALITTSKPRLKG
jgi:hypothetical protein